LLQDRGIGFEYRDYKADPLSEAEIRSVLASLDVAPSAVLRKRDRAYRELGLTGTEGDAKLIALMALHPTLLERPIGMVGNRAVVGRPPERLLTLVDN
jgi:arsenate reductase